VKQESSAEEIEQLRKALAQAHERASQAEAKILEVEAKATEVETQIWRAETRASQAEAKILEATAKIQDLEFIQLDLEHQIQVLKRCLFGSRSEKISPDELEALITEAAQEATDEILKAKRPDQPPAEAEEEQPETSESLPRGQRKARPHGRNRLPEHLPRRRIEHPIDPAQSRCPHCPGNPLLVKIGEDIREKLAKLPVQYEVQQHVYPKCVCKQCHRGVVMPEAPDDSLKADITVVADVVVQKYGEHKPLYRQQQAFDRIGIPLTRQTLCDWVGWCSDQLEPVVRAMADHIRLQPLIQSDETPVRMQLRNGQMQTARLWAYGLPWAEVVFDFRTDRSQHGPAEFLAGAQAQHIQADGGSSYTPVLSRLSMSHIACMAHIRRKIYEAREDAPAPSKQLLAAIQGLYRIEAQAKVDKIGLPALLELRSKESRPIFENVGKLLKSFEKMRPPKTPFGKAISYAQNQWKAMERYLGVPEAEIDNNSIEHALRGVVMGRRNWLHVGGEVGGERAANLFSLTISCHRLKVEPYAYLCDIVPRLSSHPQREIWKLTPRGWRDSRAQAAAEAATPTGTG
jgi:transposase